MPLPVTLLAAVIVFYLARTLWDAILLLYIAVNKARAEEAYAATRETREEISAVCGFSIPSFTTHPSSPS